MIFLVLASFFKELLCNTSRIGNTVILMVDFQWIVNGKDNYYMYLYHLRIELGDMQFHVYWFTFKFFILLFSNSRNTLKQHTHKNIWLIFD